MNFHDLRTRKVCCKFEMSKTFKKTYMDIPSTLFSEIYKVAKDVYNQKRTVNDGAKFLALDNRMKESSARDYIYDFRYLMQGKRFTRTLNAPSMEYLIDGIYTDFGREQLVIALSSLKKHIEYYESKQKGKLWQLRNLYDRYLIKAKAAELISTMEQLMQNIATVEFYLSEGNEIERAEMSDLITKGICFIAYKIGNEIRFAPSRFLGYVGNNLDLHKQSKEKDGRDTNEAINLILDSKPVTNEGLEKEYARYCHKLGIVPNAKGTFGVERKYWTLNLSHDFKENEDLTGEFPEGKIVERSHKSRERNSKVIQIAKDNFKKKHGKLFCQVCEFDFKDRYGKIGENFIEGHHTIAVSDMPPGHKTKPEEIAMLCANCHRMVHKKRPWLKMTDLMKLLK